MLEVNGCSFYDKLLCIYQICYNRCNSRPTVGAGDATTTPSKFLKGQN